MKKGPVWGFWAVSLLELIYRQLKGIPRNRVNFKFVIDVRSVIVMACSGR